MRNNNSFAEWGRQNIDSDFLNKYWDDEKNIDVNPETIGSSSSKPIYIKCQNSDYHGSYKTSASAFLRGRRCSYCARKLIHPKDSFAQWGIDSVDKDFLNKYWDYEGNQGIDPWEISKTTTKKIHIICQNIDYHKSYITTASAFSAGKRCSYCARKLIHPKDSFAQWGIDNVDKDFLSNYWDYEKNKDIDPWNLAINSAKKVFIKCNRVNYHDSYEIACHHFVNGKRCSYCKKSKIHPKDSFAQWCIDNVDKDFLDKYWDYEKNNHINPWEIAPATKKEIYIKCQVQDYHKSYLTTGLRFYSGNRCSYCGNHIVHPKDSFAQWCIDNVDKDFLDKYWDYEKNKHTDPWKIAPSTQNKIYIKCQRVDYHKSYEIIGTNFYSGSRCPYCAKKIIDPKDSFAQWAIDNVDKDFMIKYWDHEKNKSIDPWKLAPACNKKIYIKCQKQEYHGSYCININSFFYGGRCSYCGNHKVHPKDSFAQWGIDNVDKDFLDKYWDYKNNQDLNPYELHPNSNKHKVYIKCQENSKHGSYITACNNFHAGNRCNICSLENNDSKIAVFVKKRAAEIFTSIAIEYEFPIKVNVNNKQVILYPDLVLLNEKILIEVDGKQHDNFIKYFHKTRERFEHRQLCDKAKDEYFLKKGYKVIRIKLSSNYASDLKKVEKLFDDISNGLLSNQYTIVK